MSVVDVTDEPIPRPEPLRTSVYRRVIRLMTDGALHPGQTLTEAGLSKSLNVSRTPVREALLQLEAEGILRSNPARGFTVRDLDIAEAADLYPILATLESLAIRTSGNRFDLPRLRKLDAEIGAARDPVSRWRRDAAFHEKLIASTPNTTLRQLIARLRVTLSRYEIEYLRQHPGPWQHAGHADILDGLSVGNLDAATDAVTHGWLSSLNAVKAWLPAAP
jgi:DNA-binding GntR family transcriptional regulator